MGNIFNKDCITNLESILLAELKKMYIGRGLFVDIDSYHIDVFYNKSLEYCITVNGSYGRFSKNEDFCFNDIFELEFYSDESEDFIKGEFYYQIRNNENKRLEQ